MNYEDDIRIDESALDIEWLEQPKLMLEYTRHLADCEKERDMAKENVEIVKAEIEKLVRKNPEKYDVEKLTNDTVNAAILRQKSYQEAYEEYVNAQYEYTMARGAVQAFDQRKTALENMVKLHGQQYFAGPNLPRDIKKERAKLEPSPAKITRRKK